MPIFYGNRILTLPYLKQNNANDKYKYMRESNNCKMKEELTRIYPSFEQVANILPLWEKLTCKT